MQTLTRGRRMVAALAAVFALVALGADPAAAAGTSQVAGTYGAAGGLTAVAAGTYSGVLTITEDGGTYSGGFCGSTTYVGTWTLNGGAGSLSGITRRWQPGCAFFNYDRTWTISVNASSGTYAGTFGTGNITGKAVAGTFAGTLTVN